MFVIFFADKNQYHMNCYSCLSLYKTNSNISSSVENSLLVYVYACHINILFGYIVGITVLFSGCYIMLGRSSVRVFHL